MSDTIRVVPFDALLHGPFVYDSFRKSLFGDYRRGIPGVHPFNALQSLPGAAQRILEDFKRRQDQPGAVTLLAVEEDQPDDFHGWLTALPIRNELVFAFSRFTSRRLFRVCSTLAKAAGLDLSKPVPVRYWTRASERISLKPGYQLRAAVVEAEDETTKHRAEGPQASLGRVFETSDR